MKQQPQPVDGTQQEEIPQRDPNGLLSYARHMAATARTPEAKTLFEAAAEQERVRLQAKDRN